ncbi:uncharacterized protein LOC121051324 [Rosa chinensis]|uniref:uncharacterized protein LOC121051324 n=1 Tax=Rosa chinensis TaxID=74649 RepID=UPI001AD91443|nr:uncharacterized protein LOC121051324 [Rosa chinensis]
MKVLYWNVRGIANAPTQNALKDFIRVHKREILCIAEPFVALNSIPSSFWRGFGLATICTNDRGGSRPNLWLFGKISLVPMVRVLLVTDQQVTLQVMHDSVNCIITAVYARTTMAERGRLWTDLAEVKGRFVSGPWLVFGDFNAVLGAHEKKGGAPVCRRSCEEFQAMSDICELIHVDTKGAEFTWARCCGLRGNVELRLDRCLANLECTVILNILLSNVGPLFPLMVVLLRFCNISCVFYVKHSKHAWNWEVFGGIHRRVDADLSALTILQEHIAHSGGSDEEFSIENELQANLIESLRLQELFWREKSRLRWLSDGDRNTTYFHAMCRARQLRSSITLLREGDQVFEDASSIHNHVLDYYSNLFANHAEHHDNGLVDRVIPSTVTAEENDALALIPMADEILAAVKSMDADSAPGPDGFTGHFFYLLLGNSW